MIIDYIVDRFLSNFPLTRLSFVADSNRLSIHHLSPFQFLFTSTFQFSSFFLQLLVFLFLFIFFFLLVDLFFFHLSSVLFFFLLKFLYSIYLRLELTLVDQFTYLAFHLLFWYHSTLHCLTYTTIVVNINMIHINITMIIVNVVNITMIVINVVNVFWLNMVMSIDGLDVIDICVLIVVWLVGTRLDRVLWLFVWLNRCIVLLVETGLV